MTRHQLKEQDEITTYLEKGTDFVLAKKREVTIGIAAFAAVLIIVFGALYYRSSRNAAAEAQLSQAINTYNDTVNIKAEKERYEKTLAEAQKTYDGYSSTTAGKIALYYVGISQEGLGDT